MLGTISIILKILYYKTSILLQVNTLTTCTFSLVNKNVCRSQNIFLTVCNSTLNKRS